MTDENETRIKEKLDFFLEQKVKVHVKLIDKTFLNGTIAQKLKEGTYWFIDKVFNGVYLFSKDVYEVNGYLEVGE